MSKKKLTMLLNSNQTAGILLVALVSVAVMWGRPTLGTRHAINTGVD
jgi:hypothetical protein